MSDFERLEWSHTLWDPLEKKSSRADAHGGPIRVAAYCRVSTEKTISFDSLINQVSYYTRFITGKKNWKFVGIYFDYGVSGLTTNRTSFKRMIRHCEEGRIDLILTKSVDRVSRNSKDLIETVNRLKELDIAVVFEKEGIDTSQHYNSLLFSTYAALAQAEVESVAQHTEWGFQKRFLQGIPAFKRMYGYFVEYIDDQPVFIVHEAEAVILRQIFAMFLKGSNYTDISHELIRLGIKTCTGKDTWTPGHIKKILTNITYTGQKIARTLTTDTLTRTYKSTNGERDVYFFENSHPAIISEEVFRLAQKRVEEVSKNRVTANKPRTIRPFSQRLLCGHCGRKYYSRGIHRWRCNGSILSSDLCDTKTINDKGIRTMIIKAWEEIYDFSSQSTYRDLLKVIERVNQNDFFEFHRLKRLAKIEIVYRRTQNGNMEAVEELNRLKKDYSEFGAEVGKIEEDRVYRDAAINWAKGLRSSEEFKEQINMECLRAWVKEITVFSRCDYIVHWIDNTQTVVGDCTPRPKPQPKFEKFDRDLYQPEILVVSSKMKSEQLAPNETTMDLLHEAEGVIDTVHTSVASDVIKIDPGTKIDLKKLINQSLKGLDNKRVETMYTSVSKQKTAKKTLKVAAYCRVSTQSKEQHLSLKTQIAYYTYLILKNPEWEFAGIYADDGISGTSVDNRKDFLRLIDDCKAGKVNLIISKSLSRLSRDIVSCLESIQTLKNLPEPVHCYFEKENIHTADPESDLLLTVHASVAQEESVNLSSSSTWGLRSLAQQGVVAKNYICYGYKRDESGNWIVNDEEKKVYIRIYKEFLNGQTMTSIARGLTNDGIKSPNGCDKWNSRSIANILRNESYKGGILYQKTYRPAIPGPRVANDAQQLPQFYIERHHQALIEDDVWDEIQNEFNNRQQGIRERQRSRRSPGRKEFYKRFYCGTCHGVVSRLNISTNPKQSNWRCYNTINADRPEHCNKFSFTEEYIEQNFMRMLLRIQQENDFSAKVELAIEELELKPEEVSKKQKLEVEINGLNQELYDEVDEQLNQSGRDAKRVDFLTREIIKRQEELKELDLRVETANNYRMELQWLLAEVNNLIMSKSGIVEFNAEIFERIVEQGTIYPEGQITYKLSLGVEYGISLTRQEYLTQQASLKRAAKEDELFNSKRVKQMLEFCREPKGFGELCEFLDMGSRDHCRRRIINPLMEKGKLRRIDRKEVGGRYHKYCSVR